MVGFIFRLHQKPAHFLDHFRFESLDCCRLFGAKRSLSAVTTTNIAHMSKNSIPRSLRDRPIVTPVSH
ncbi:MAG: hypothetical protein OJF48_003349 [Afipia sp.]|nr:MAG: hypothetical protein OJF48_003349 [Afipia sp.]